METWKDIDGFDGFYQISDKGNFRGKGNKNGRIDGEWHSKAVKVNRDGYKFVCMQYNGKTRTTRIHRLVAETFIPNPDNLETVNHIDGDKTNNCVENLEWADRHHQLKHAYDHGLKQAARGTSNCHSKLTDKDVRYIRSHYVKQSKEFGTVALSRKFGVSNRVIGLVARGLSYQNVV